MKMFDICIAQSAMIFVNSRPICLRELDSKAKSESSDQAMASPYTANSESSDQGHESPSRSDNKLHSLEEVVAPWPAACGAYDQDTC